MRGDWWWGDGGRFRALDKKYDSLPAKTAQARLE